MMPIRKVPFFTKLDPELVEAMARYKTNVGVPVAQQVERALREWLAARPEAWPLPELKGVKKTGRTRVSARKRP